MARNHGLEIAFGRGEWLLAGLGAGQVIYSICIVSRNALASGSLEYRELALDG